MTANTAPAWPEPSSCVWMKLKQKPLSSSHLSFGTADVLSDPETRAIYDQQGLEGLQRSRSGAAAGPSSASKAWDEFKPFQKDNKRTQARSSSASNSETGAEDRGPDS